MGIKFYCSNGHKIHVKVFLAGKRGICPKCGEKVEIPSESQGSEPTADSNVLASNPARDAPDATWYVRPITGGQYGPAPPALMRSWIDEGRVRTDSFVWRDGWLEWQKAGQIFPGLSMKNIPSNDSINVTTPPGPEIGVAVSQDPTRLGRVRAPEMPIVRKQNRTNLSLIAVIVLVMAILGLLPVLLLVARGL